MPERSYRKLLWSLALLGATLDLASKYVVFAWLYGQAQHTGRTYGEYEVVPGAFKLLAQYTFERVPADQAGGSWLFWGCDVMPKVNHGALFGLGGEYVKLANAVFAGVSVLAAAAIVYWSLRRATARDWILCAALGLILAGTLGNLFDRLVFHGVRDFLYFYWIEWPVFNVADCCLVGGAALLLTQAFWTQPAADDVPVPAAATVLEPEVAQAK